MPSAVLEKPQLLFPCQKQQRQILPHISLLLLGAILGIFPLLLHAEIMNLKHGGKQTLGCL